MLKPSKTRHYLKQENFLPKALEKYLLWARLRKTKNGKDCFLDLFFSEKISKPKDTVRYMIKLDNAGLNRLRIAKEVLNGDIQDFIFPEELNQLKTLK